LHQHCQAALIGHAYRFAITALRLVIDGVDDTVTGDILKDMHKWVHIPSVEFKTVNRYIKSCFRRDLVTLSMVSFKRINRLREAFTYIIWNIN
jgi:hypothetical protein